MASKKSELVTLTKVVKDYTEICLLDYNVRKWLNTHVGEHIKNRLTLSDWAIEQEYKEMGGTFIHLPRISRSLVVGSGWKLINSCSRNGGESVYELFLQLEWMPDVMQLKLKYF